MAKPGMIKVVMIVDEVNDPAKAKEKLPAMIDNARKVQGCLNFDFCEMVGDNTKYAMFGAFESEDAYNAFKDNEKVKQAKENFKSSHKGDWTIKTFKVLY